MAYTYAYGTSVHVTIHVAPESVDRFFVAFERFYQNVIREDECLSFQMYRNPAKPGNIVWVEDWSESPEWYCNHRITKDYYREYLIITRPMLIFEREVEFFERPPPYYSFSRVDYENYRQWTCAS
ncbi:hypothetical protein F4680DRAFT_440541 [Xylaria scruposa]|nr:hypothetical protein F4680DRAFT_440541 [Xylaria scruposa]